jgi:hypothetical protein
MVFGGDGDANLHGRCLTGHPNTDAKKIPTPHGDDARSDIRASRMQPHRFLDRFLDWFP